MNDPRDAAPTETAGGLRAVRSWESGRLVVVLYGDLDIDSLPAAQDEVSAAHGEGPDVLVLDLTQLGYVDSSGVRLVLLAQQVAEETGRHFAVRLGHGPTRRVFDMLGITDRLDVLDVLDDGEAT
jgi:anti-anti-sigma factor